MTLAIEHHLPLTDGRSAFLTAPRDLSVADAERISNVVLALGGCDRPSAVASCAQAGIAARDRIIRALVRATMISPNVVGLSNDDRAVLDEILR